MVPHDLHQAVVLHYLHQVADLLHHRQVADLLYLRQVADHHLLHLDEVLRLLLRLVLLQDHRLNPVQSQFVQVEGLHLLADEAHQCLQLDQMVFLKRLLVDHQGQEDPVVGLLADLVELVVHPPPLQSKLRSYLRVWSPSGSPGSP